MMVLMTSQGGTASEGFLAVLERTFVRSLTRVDATMSSERTRIAKRLGVVLISVPDVEKKSPIENTFVQCSHMCGFSPVWTRPCTVNADL